MKKIVLIGLLAAFLTACGSSLSGLYTGGPAGITLDFKSNGKVVYGGAMECDYEVDGTSIKIHTPQGTVLATIVDGTTIKFMGAAMKKR